MAFIAKIPSFGKVFYCYDDDELSSYLTGLGFSKSKKGIIDYDTCEEEVSTYKLSLSPSQYCIIKHGRGYEWGWYEFTLVGFPEEWAQVKAEAKRYEKSFLLEDPNPWMEIKGHTISWGNGA